MFTFLQCQSKTHLSFEESILNVKLCLMKLKFLYLIIVAFAIFITIATYSYLNGTKKEDLRKEFVTETENVIESVVENVTHPTQIFKKNNLFSIEELRTKQYTSSDIKIENVVQDTNAFISYRISFNSDGLHQYALMSVPKSTMPEKGFPVVMLAHGYIYPPSYSTENSYINPARYFASNGFLVLKPDYRGHGKSEGHTDRRIMDQIEYALDVRNLLESINKVPKADPSNIFLYGHSMGGEIGVRILEIYPSIRAATLWAPSIFWYPESQMYFIRNLFPYDVESSIKQLADVVSEEEYSEVGALENVKFINTPVNIHHSNNDNVTPYLWGKTLYDELIKAGKTATLYTYEGTSHQLGSGYSQALKRDLELFKKYIQ